jgi:anaerobic magnesium-protoporphyrin IX monomethyl ester cyclase
MAGSTHTMKILLVYPYFLDNRINEEDVSAFPMGLYYVGAMLRANGYAVDILNGYNLGRAPHRIYQVLGDKRPDVVGFSILHANRWGGIDIARMAKKVNPNVTVVFGGVGATFLWEHFLTHFPQIDYVVRGEGEHSFLELIRFLEKKSPNLPTHIHGLAFQKAGKPLKPMIGSRWRIWTACPCPPITSRFNTSHSRGDARQDAPSADLRPFGNAGCDFTAPTTS